MERYDLPITIPALHRVCFTHRAFSLENAMLQELLQEGGGRRALVCIEQAVANAWPRLADEVREYLAASTVELRELLIRDGGESAKRDDALVREVWQAVERAGIDRHSYLIVIGGGAFLDAVGFAAATAHRGVRLVRFPTTTLAQDDSGVGVKNGINAFGKKNWIGAFAVPFAVVNDFTLLSSQEPQVHRQGLIEAIKVALVKDAEFFAWIEQERFSLLHLHTEAVEECVKRSALWHARHIAQGGDPFEMGSSRPLDFGHWAAHKLEQLSDFSLSHAEAVAIGLALDVCYAWRVGLMAAADAQRVLRLLQDLSLPIDHPALHLRDESGALRVLAGLEEFREHLGGRLTVLLLQAPGRGIDVHEMDHAVIEHCVAELSTLPLSVASA